MLDILLAALLAFAPNCPEAKANVTAAMAAAKATGVPVELLLAMAYHESDFDPLSLSRMEKGKRVTGRWAGDLPPRGAKPTWYCGVMQVGGDVPWEVCQSYRKDLTATYLAGAMHLVEWAKLCKGHRDLVRCQLQGYSGGYRAIRGNWKDYANAVLYQEERLRQLEQKPNS